MEDIGKESFFGLRDGVLNSHLNSFMILFAAVHHEVYRVALYCSDWEPATVVILLEKIAFKESQLVVQPVLQGAIALVPISNWSPVSGFR